MKARIPNHVFRQMTKEESNELAMLSFNGFMQHDDKGNTTVMMGSKAFNMLQEFENKMIEKYGNNK